MARDFSGIRRGALSGLATVVMLYFAAVPSRLSLAVRGWGLVSLRIEKMLVGSLLDLSAVIALFTPLIAIFALALPFLFARLRTPRWQRLGALFVAFPFGFVISLLTVTAQEVKSERGSFPTTFDLLEGGTNASFLEGTVGYLRYERIWEPAVVGLVLTAVLLFIIWRRRHEVRGWRHWGTGLLGGLAGGTALVVLLNAGLAAAANKYTAAALGDPLTTIVESSIDMMSHKGPATPRDLVLTAEFPAGTAEEGARRLGWAPKSPGKALSRPRPLDWTKEPPTKDPRGRKLLDALAKVSAALFDPQDAKVAIFQVSLEGFRADDVHALNAAAPAQIAPFTSGLYSAPQKGVLTSRRMFQAGVRTAHCLGAMTCGVGTLPYNLAFIRDLQPFPVRCASDVLRDAGFVESFFYGSDPHFDEMHRFFSEHGFTHLVSQAELPADAPKGTWDGVTDLAVFDFAAKDVASKMNEGPQFAFLMSLSNHSPFTAPQDQPPEVVARVDEALKTAVNRADSDDRLRLLTYSYTDLALERLVNGLDGLGLADRSIVMVMSDHSTGHSYVWGPKDPETDEAKTQIPFAIIIPPQFVARAKDPAALDAALTEVQTLLDEAPLSQNDVPSMLLALLSSVPPLKALPEEQRWHTLGGQVTSPYFQPGGEASTYILGINGVSELYAFDRQGARVGGYEDSVFLKTRADRYRVTPRLIPITATLIETMKTDAK
ncbi:MAG: LTA synthase family protein [Myxococcaceae bacterium]